MFSESKQLILWSVSLGSKSIDYLKERFDSNWSADSKSELVLNTTSLVDNINRRLSHADDRTGLLPSHSEVRRILPGSQERSKAIETVL
jgi:hypothetical protein